MFVTTEASLLVKMANEISALLEMNTPVLTSRGPSLLFSYTPVCCSRVPMYVTTPINTFYLLNVCGSERQGFALQCFSFITLSIALPLLMYKIYALQIRLQNL